MQEEKQRGA